MISSRYYSTRRKSRIPGQPTPITVDIRIKKWQIISVLPLLLLYLYLGIAFGCIQVYLAPLPFRCYTPIEDNPIFDELRNSDNGRGFRKVEQLLLPDSDLSTNPRRFESPHSCKKYSNSHVDWILKQQNGRNITPEQFQNFINVMAKDPPEYVDCGKLGWKFSSDGVMESNLRSHYRLVCDREIHLDTMRSLGSLGQLFGSVFLSLGDITGRSFLFVVASSVHLGTGFLMLAMRSFMGYVTCYTFYMGSGITLFALGLISASEYWSDNPKQRIIGTSTLTATFGVGIAFAGKISLHISTWTALHSMITTFYLVIAVLLFPLIAFISNHNIFREWRQIPCWQLIKQVLCPCLIGEENPNEARKGWRQFIKRPSFKTSFVLRLYDDKQFRFVSWLLTLNWTANTLAYYSVGHYVRPSNWGFPSTIKGALYEGGMFETLSILLHLGLALWCQDRIKAYCLFLALCGASRTFSLFFQSFPILEFILATISSLTAPGAFNALYLLTIELLPGCYRCTLLGVSSAGGRLVGVIVPQVVPLFENIFHNLIWMLCGCLTVGAALSSLAITGGSKVGKLCRTFEECVDQRMYYTLLDMDEDRRRQVKMMHSEQQTENHSIQTSYRFHNSITVNPRQQLIFAAHER